MMKIKSNIFSLLLFTFFLTNCERTIENRMLLRTDSLLIRSELDSANQILSVLEHTYLSKEDHAYYKLLKAISLYKAEEETISDTLFDSSISFYRNRGNRDRLATALIYKGTVLIEEGRYVEAATNLKEAQNIAQSSKNEEVVIRSQIMLSILNLLSHNYQLSLENARNSLYFAKQFGNKRWIGYTLNHMSVVFDYVGEKDSSAYYSRLFESYLQFQPKKDQPYFLTNIAIQHLQEGNDSTAEVLLMQSLKMEPLPETYGKLAQLYTKQGKLNAAAKLWNNVFTISDYSKRILFLGVYSEWLQQQGRYIEAYQAEKERIAIKDTLYKEQQTEAVMAAQADFDYQQKIIRWQRWAIVGLCFLIALLVIFGILEYRSWKRKQITEKILMDNRQLIITYESQLKTLCQQQKQWLTDHQQGLANIKEGERRIKELERRVAQLRDEQNRLLTVGKTHYKKIVQGGTAVSWKKRDFESFLEYYRTIAPEYVINLGLQYPSLTPQMRFYLSLLKLGYSTDEARNIMGLSPTAHRKLKSRIKACGHEGICES